MTHVSGAYFIWLRGVDENLQKLGWTERYELGLHKSDINFDGFVWGRCNQLYSDGDKPSVEWKITWIKISNPTPHPHVKN